MGMKITRAVKHHIIRGSMCDTEGDWHEPAFDENSSKNSISSIERLWPFFLKLFRLRKT